MLHTTTLDKPQQVFSVLSPFIATYDVEETREYLLQFACVHSGDLQYHGAVAVIDFQDDKGQLIGGRSSQGDSADEFKSRSPIPVFPDATTCPLFLLRVVAPPGSAQVRLRLLPDKCECVRLASPVQLQACDGHLCLDETERIIGFEVDPIWKYGFYAVSACEEAGDSQSGVVALRYTDAAGTLIPWPYDAQHAVREGFGECYSIKRDRVNVPAKLRMHLTPPCEGQHVWLGFRSATAVPMRLRCELTLGRLELQRKRTSVAKLLAEVSGTMKDDSDSALQVVHGVLSADPRNTTALKLLFRLQERTGDVYAAEKTAEGILKLSPSPEAVDRLSKASGRLREMDPNWAPRVRGPVEKLPACEGIKVMHLLKVTYPFESSGGSIRNRAILAAQRRAGLVPYAVTPLGYPTADGYPMAPKEMIDDVAYYRLDPGRNARIESLATDRRLELDTFLTAAVLRTEGAAVIHAASGVRGYELALKGLALREHFQIPLVYEVRSFHEHTWGPAGLRTELADHTLARMVQENRCMREADLVVTISETMRTALEQRGVPAAKIRVVPNAVDVDKFVPQAPDLDLAKRLGVHGKQVLGYISNISRREGHDVLLRGLRELIGNGLPVVGLIVGEGPERRNLEELASRLGIRQHVVFSGAVDHREINAFYSIIDLFVVPRRRDYASDLVTPLKPFEAMAMGKPLLVSDRPALLEVVTPGVRGLAFRSEDHVDLARQAAHLLNDSTLRNELATNAREWVLKCRTWQHAVKTYQIIYSEAIRQWSQRC